MDLFEFQAKELLGHFGIKTPKSRVIESEADAERAAERLGVSRFVVKVQVRAGERREAGGIQFAASPSGVRATCDRMLGQQFVSRQTSRRGEQVRYVLVEEAIENARHIYAAIVLSKAHAKLSLLTAAAGGDGIEERAAREPDLIEVHDITIQGDRAVGPFAEAVKKLGLPSAWNDNVTQTLERMAHLAVALDASQVEINPLAIKPDGTVVALDAKVILDANALFRHPALSALSKAFEAESTNPDETSADAHRINYIALPGEVGIIVNGAGLALATLDLLAEHGGKPANFMDIRTTASSMDIAHGTRLILENPRAKTILVNVHGGGMQRCDTIAEGISVAMKAAPRQLPIVARLAGNNAVFAQKRLLDAGLDVTFTDTMDAAARAATSSSRRTAA